MRSTIAAMRLYTTLIDDTFCEAFLAYAARLIVTAADAYWLDAAIRAATGYGTSIIGCDAEVGVEQQLSPDVTPDAREGAALLIVARSAEDVAHAAQQRTGQCLMTAPTTTVFDGLPEAATRFDLGRWLSGFGDGYEYERTHAGRDGWAIPVTAGEFFCEATAGVVEAVAGGTLLLGGGDPQATLAAARRAVEAITPLPGVITPFPGGVCRCASKAGSTTYPGVIATIQETCCPTLRGRVDSRLPDEVQCIYEIVIDGLDRAVVARAMRRSIHAAAGHDLRWISTSHFGGRLGKIHLPLHDILTNPPMRVLCAPDSFKESLAASDAAAAVARGIRTAGGGTIEADECPIADGGEGTVETLIAATQGERRTSRVTSPLGETVSATWGLLGEQAGERRTAVIEMAAASGLPLVPPDQRDPTRTTTFGTGELLRAAMDEGVERIILGIGGSATCDGGCGAAQALGVRFLDDDDRLIAEPMTGGMLGRVARIDVTQLDARLRDGRMRLEIACDVDNPLTGERGAAAVYGPQKGAMPEQVTLLDRHLAHAATLFEHATGKTVRDMPGAGAAGGFGAGAVALLGATLRRGVELVLDVARVKERLQHCDLCLTGEGRLDGQTLSGKAILGVARMAAQAGVPTIALVGSVGEGAQRTLGPNMLRDYIIISDGLSQADAMARADELLEAAAQQVIRSMHE